MPSVSFAEFARLVLSRYRSPMRRTKTRKRMELALREFAAFCPDTGSIDGDRVADWMVAHAGGRSAIASFAVLRAFARACRLGVEAGVIGSNPFQATPPARWWPDGDLEPPERVRHLSADQARRLLELADAEALAAEDEGRWLALRLATLVKVYLYTGLRKSEALGLKLEDVDLAAGLIAVRPNERRPLKNRASRRRVPIPPQLGAVLASWMPLAGPAWLFPGVRRSGPWTGGPAGRKALDEVRRLGRRAGVPSATILALRHTFLTMLEDLGFGETMVQRLAGHRDRVMQRRYRHEDLAALARAGARIVI